MNESLLAESLWIDTEQLHEVSRIEAADVVNLRLAKLNATLSSLRWSGRVDLGPRILDIQDKLMMIEYHAQAQEKLKKQQERIEKAAGAPAHRDPLADLNDTPDVPESSLRRRRRHTPIAEGAGADLGSKLDVQEYEQQELGEDILEMVKAIKQNVIDFGQKLETDKDLVSATTDAITRTGASVSSVGSRLMKYRRSSAIGWMFYIYATLFIVGVWILSIVLIQLVPKW